MDMQYFRPEIQLQRCTWSAVYPSPLASLKPQLGDDFRLGITFELEGPCRFSGQNNKNPSRKLRPEVFFQLVALGKASNTADKSGSNARITSSSDYSPLSRPVCEVWSWHTEVHPFAHHLAHTAADPDAGHCRRRAQRALAPCWSHRARPDHQMLISELQPEDWPPRGWLLHLVPNWWSLWTALVWPGSLDLIANRDTTRDPKKQHCLQDHAATVAILGGVIIKMAHGGI